MDNTTKNKKSQTKLTYSDIEPIVEYLVKVKSHNHTFDCWTADDIGQEIRLICLKALTHFDVDRVEPTKWKNYFGRCVDNALFNLKRDNYIRFQTPCNSDCELLHSDDEELEKICKKWINHQVKIAKQKNIKHPVNIDIVGDVRDYRFEKQLEVEDTKKYLLKNIEPSLRRNLKIIMDGNGKSVPKSERIKIQANVKILLEEQMP